MRYVGLAAVLIGSWGVAACERSPETPVAPSAVAGAVDMQQQGAPDSPTPFIALAALAPRH